MRGRRGLVDLVVVAALGLYAWVFPELPDFTEHLTLTLWSIAATAACAHAAWRGFPEARSIWLRFAAAGAALTVHHALFFIPVTEPSTAATVRGTLITAVVTLALVIGGSGLVLTIRPLLSYSPTRRAAVWMAPLALIGVCTVPLADPLLLSFAGGITAALSVGFSIAVCLAMLAGLAMIAPELVALDRTAELFIGMATIALFGVTSYTVLTSYTQYWALPGIVAMAFASRGALARSSRFIGAPLADRPIVTRVRYRRAAGAVVPMTLLIPAVGLGAAPWVSMLAVVTTLALASLFMTELWFGHPAQAERPPERIVAIGRALQAAIVEDHLTLHYQPIVSLSDRTVRGFESLLRWPDSSYGDLGPEELLTAARWQGLVAELECWVVAHAASRLDTLRADTASLYLTVNLTPWSLQQPGFADRLLSQLAAAGRTLRGMTIEIVEYGHIGDWPALRENVTRLKAAGALVALDDFGAGTSNLQTLSELDADLVKLDASIVRWAGRGGHRIVQQVVDMARSAGLGVVAEGIETEELLTAVLGLGVELGQGYLFSRPVNLEAAVALVASPALPQVVPPATPARTPPASTPAPRNTATAH